MSSIMIEIGQCGCQIGSKLNHRLSSSYYCTRVHKPNKIHSIMIDTQPKVLKPFIQKPPKWLDPSNVKYFQYGRGNNWSYGYMHELPDKMCNEEYVQGHKQFSHQYEKGQNQQINKYQQAVLINKYIKQNREICAYTLEKTRKELESCDCPSSIAIICSLGGGTGSGLGTKIIQEIYNEFEIDVHAHVILPNKSGQTPLQIYNCALSLASIQSHCAAIFPYQNDNMTNMFLPEGKIPNSNDLDVINQGIASMMSRLITINDIEGYNQFYNFKVNECILSREMNYLSLFGSAGKTIDESFENMFNQLKIYNEDTFWIDGVQTKREKCLAQCLVGFGKEEAEFENKFKKKLKHIINPVESMTNMKYEHIKTKKDESEVLLLMNHTNIVRYLEYISKSGRKKLLAKAYLWHYKYADLQGAFDCIDSVVDQYVYFSN